MRMALVSPNFKSKQTSLRLLLLKDRIDYKDEYGPACQNQLLQRTPQFPVVA